MLTGDTNWDPTVVDAGKGPLTRILSRRPGLRRLVVFKNQLIGAIPSEIGLLHDTLDSVELAYNHFSSNIPSELGALTSVEKLFLEANDLTGTIPSSLGEMENMMFMDIAANLLTGPCKSYTVERRSNRTILFMLTPCTLYRFFIFCHHTVPSELGNLPSIQMLNMRSNELSGALPSEIGKMTTLYQLDLSGNSELGGPIPPELGQLSSLLALSLKRTSLTGTIPESLCRVRDLWFDCSPLLCGCDCECDGFET